MKKFLVVGGGSMGKRRIRCLLANKIQPEQVRLVEVREDRRDEVKQKHNVDSFSRLDEGLRWDPAAVIVSVPGVHHISVLLAAARAGKPAFCEVPLSTTLDHMDELERLVEEKSLLIASGCQPPFHPVLKAAREWIRDPEFGRVLAMTYQTGQYLPDWHPYEDYRNFYGSSIKMGGSNMDVIAQEINVVRLLIGEKPDNVFCRTSHISSLEIDGSDCQQILATTPTGVQMSFHFDLIQRSGYSGHRIISEKGTIVIENGQAKRYLAATKQWETVAPPEGFVYEQCYIDEIGCFLRCLDGEETWPISLAASIQTVRFLLAMQKSSSEQQVVTLDDVLEVAK